MKEAIEDIDDLEDSYQQYRVLRRGGEFEVTIENIGVDEQGHVYVQFRAGKDIDIPIRFTQGPNADDYAELLKLCRMVNAEFHSNITGLENKRVTIELKNSESVKIIEIDKVCDRISGEDQYKARDLPPKIPRNKVLSTIALVRWQEQETDVYQTSISDVSLTDNQELSLSIEMYGGELLWEIPIPNEEDMGDSKFTRVVEELGGGSVEMIEDREVYIRKIDNLGFSTRSFINTIGHVDDAFSTWGIFLEREEAENPKVENETYNKKGITEIHSDVSPEDMIPLRTQIAFVVVIIVVLAFLPQVSLLSILRGIGGFILIIILVILSFASMIALIFILAFIHDM